MEYTCTKNINESGSEYNGVILKTNYINMQESINEVHTYLTALTTNSLVAINYDKTLDPMDVVSDEVSDDDILNLKTNITRIQDYLQSCAANWLADHNAYKSSNLITHDLAVHNAERTGVNATHNITDHTTEDFTYDAVARGTICATDFASNLSANDSVAKVSNLTTNYTTQYNSNYSGDNASVNSSNRTSVCSSNYSSDNSGVNVTVYAGNKTSVNASNCPSYYGSYNSVVKTSNLTTYRGANYSVCHTYSYCPSNYSSNCSST